ncbi:DEKNAAC104129 [Brettanomyces naardenensis]|uniref:DEKNAAC104129 n=1 Tax=Brettanomyces naardenensis TaxID=13370 RepID=A0A448YQ30_BRENA|nr:DEKNAAC104129 [Brettanomyces naardenensis]
MLRLNTLYRRFSTVALPEKSKTLEKFAFKHFTQTIGDVNKGFSGLLNEKVTLNGWIDGSPRKISKNLVFAGFRDFNGDFTQITAKGEEISQVVRGLKPEDALSVTGRVSLKRMKEGEQVKQWELLIDDLEVLNYSNEKASQLDSLKSTPSQYPPEYRYLQLRSPYYQKALKMRSEAAHVARSVFQSLNFTEIETPMLFKSTPEGAKEFLVPTRRKGLFYALPQSPQQYKQLLMASGFKGYYQIAKCFRDEDLRADRQPEFTQIDMEMSFAKSEDVQHVIQKLLTSIWKDVRGLPLYRIDPNDESVLIKLEDGEDFPKMNYMEALTRYGIDKPDLRATLSFKDVSSFFTQPLKRDDFGVTEACVLKGALEKGSPKKILDSSSYSRKPYIFKIKNEEDLQKWAKALPNEPANVDQLNEFLDLQVGDVVAIGDRAKFPYESPTPLGRFRQLAMEEYPTSWRRNIEGSPAANDIFVSTWLVNFPLFSPSEGDIIDGYPVYDFDNLESTHHPFTMVKLEDYELLATDPLKAKGDHYDLVVNGVEVGGGSRRVHDAELQKFIFANILKIDDYMSLFGHLLHALSSGCPPHAGLAIGFDRMCSMLLGCSSIRDVVAFPKTQAGTDPVVESPSRVPEKTLALYGIEERKDN